MNSRFVAPPDPEGSKRGPIYIGIDLAWTANRKPKPPPYESGFCVLEHAENGDLICSQVGAAKDHVDEIADIVSTVADGSTSVVVAIDAPLIIGNDRQAERKLNRAFGRYSAGAYHTKMILDPDRNIDAGRRLGELLQATGFTLEPSSVHEGGARSAVEVYPHPIHVGLFQLEERIPYKKGNKEAKRLGLECYQQCMFKFLKEKMPSLLGNPDIRHALSPDALQRIPAKTKTGRPSLKHYEDVLDALTCAIAAWQYRTNSNNWKIYGEPESGYIVAPKAPDRIINSH